MAVDIEELKRLEAEATPGPWVADGRQPLKRCTVDHGEPNHLMAKARGECRYELTGWYESELLEAEGLRDVHTAGGDRVVLSTDEYGGTSIANARLIAAMRNALPELLDEYERLTRKVCDSMAKSAELQAERDRAAAQAEQATEALEAERKRADDAQARADHWAACTRYEWLRDRQHVTREEWDEKRKAIGDTRAVLKARGLEP